MREGGPFSENGTPGDVDGPFGVIVTEFHLSVAADEISR